MYLVRLGEGTTAPTPLTITADANAIVGAKTISVTVASGTPSIPKNTVLTFTDGASAAVKVVVTATTTLGTAPTNLPIEAFEGAQGDGIDTQIDATDTAVWDGLHTDIASNSLDFSANEQTNELTAVTHGSATGVRVATPEVTSVQPTIQRQGLFFADGQLYEWLVKNAKTPNANWWAKYVLPDPAGDPAVVYAGLARVSGVGHPTPADNYVQMSYSARFISDAYTISTASDFS